MCIAQQSLGAARVAAARVPSGCPYHLCASHARSEDHSTKSAAGVALVTTCRILWISGGAAGAVRLEHVVRAEADVRALHPLFHRHITEPYRQALAEEIALRAQGGSFFGLANSAKILLKFTVSGTEQRLKLAFHDGGRDAFLGAADGALRKKSWVVRCSHPCSSSASDAMADLFFPARTGMCTCALCWSRNT